MDIGQYVINKIKLLLNEPEMNQEKLANKIGVHRVDVSRIVSGKRGLNWDFVQKFLKAYPVNITEPGEAPASEPQVKYIRTQAVVKHIPAKAAAGEILRAGTQAVMEDDITSYEFPGLSKGPDYYDIRVQGDSMHPTIKDDEIIFISRMEKLDDIKDSRIYVICSREVDEGWIVKRCYRNIVNGQVKSITCVSDNKLYKDITIPAPKVDAVFYVHRALRHDFTPPYQEINDDFISLKKSVEEMKQLLKTKL